jgi:hypothetical protein
VAVTAQELVDGISSLEEVVQGLDAAVSGTPAGPAREAIRALRDAIRAALEELKHLLRTGSWTQTQPPFSGARELTPEEQERLDAFWKKGHDWLISKLLGAGVEKLLEKAGAKILGKALGPIVEILLDPSEIGGHAFDLVDSLITVIKGQCYLIIWYRTGWEDEIQRSEIKVVVLKIKCPGGGRTGGGAGGGR